MTKEELIARLEENYEKIYFYCVKRCNNRMDAEDLSQTILLEIIQNINKGIKIDNFDYYIWAICKNQYNRYLKEIVTKREKMDLVEEIDEPADNIGVLDEIVYDENISRMNAAIKLLSKDYSEILYAYYVEDKKLSYIAEELKLPLGTVTRKLTEIRKKLKGYLEMEKLNGKKAYVPKNFVGIMAGESEFNPHEYTSPLMIKNLLYHSYKNPCSIEDYSIELGISRPYVEDYVNDLIEKEFLIKSEDEKYLTNIAFIDKNLRKEIYEYIRQNIHKFSNEVIKLSKELLPEYKKLVVDSNIDDELLMWSLMCLVIVKVEDKYRNYSYTKHFGPNNANWDFIMMEYLDCLNEDEFFISYNYNTDGSKVVSWFPASTEKNAVSKIISWRRDGNIYDVFQLAKEIEKCSENELIYSELDAETKEKINKYIELNYLTIVNDVVIYKTPRITRENYEKLCALINESQTVHKELKALYDEVKNMVCVNLTPNLYEQMDFIVDSTTLNRSQVLTKAYEEGLLKDDEGTYFPYNKLIIM